MAQSLTSPTVTEKFENNLLTISLGGRIDSSNSESVEQKINEMEKAHPGAEIQLDLEELEYISSAGLRVILRLRKSHPELKLVNVSAEVYDILEMTGFSEMMPCEKAYRRLSVEGCEVIGQGSNGKVYRIDRDTIIKVYLNPDSLPDIHRERELARKAFILGIPTAIPYDVVKVGEGYGSVFELLNATSFTKLIQQDPASIDHVIDMYVDLLKKIHATELKPGDMPDMKQVALGWADFLKDYLPEEVWQKIHDLVAAVPENHHMMHGDYHTKNVMLQNGEVLLIDMDTLCMGDPIFEFASIYNAYQGFVELNHEHSKEFLGLDYDTCCYLWNQTVRRYFEGALEEEIQAIKEKSTLMGQIRLMRRSIRRMAGTPEGQAQIECSKNHILELAPKIDSLLLK